MPYTFNLRGPRLEIEITKVRDEIDDVTEASSAKVGTDYFVSNDRIQSRLENAREEAPADSNDVEIRLMACASILDTLATNVAIVRGKETTLSTSTDGTAISVALQQHAKRCRDRAAASLKSRREAAAVLEAARSRFAEPCGGNFALLAVG